MQLSKKSFAVGILSVFWGLIIVSMLTGVWQAKTTAEQVVVKTPEDIKGWMKIEEISTYLKIPVPDIAKALQIKGELDPHKSLKDLASANDKTADDYKEMLEKYLASGEKGSIPATTEPKDSGESNSNSDSDIKGYMTFQQVADKYAISVETIYKELKIPSGQDPGVPMKDVAGKYNFEVEQVRDLVAKVKK